ncbi:uncharacterized protein LOC118442027 [Vespa mandarinia]|uniref:uncharacterized protein LOC118442027 n=1 Tax=Vespa mandarinia TaxID=7446 RepID=UPI0016076B1B|nr:uncharacterized protein LOC118442027 [Vespa mandarinia]XP_035723052.1 uncharacterized protein LOC118442027 [Vespa mandarinia]XP_035723053.1 uncharacterized protein LOC118442027 [Vespa mandarinia]XP_035723054.1 uncharacterized protein LOC118442027 [Vespa mandarinia]XP_035723055.1 uncharacterized protein LOC118442027 [Vespa mandarinia]
MTMTMQKEFKDLLNDFLNISKPYIDNNALEEIKSEYYYQINSKRKISGIKEFEELIKLLEKYTIISYDNIKQLYFINKIYVKKSNLLIRLEKYESNYNQAILSKYFPPNYNMYQSDNDEETFDQIRWRNPLEELRYESLLSEVPEQFSKTSYNRESELKQMVLLKVNEQIGRSWKHVCRRLGLKENEINEIEKKNSSNLKKQSYQALDICISQNNSDWKINLLHALEKERRKDIKEVVEKILLDKKI